jgi:hypothetical protein
VEIAKTSDVPGGFYDERPQGLYRGIFETRLAGIYARNLDGLSLQHVAITWGQPTDKSYGDALDQADVTNLELDHVQLAPSPNAAPAPGK